VSLTRSYARSELALLAAEMSQSDTARDLVARYKVSNSLLGGCVAAARIEGQEYSLHHLRALQLIDRVGHHIDLGTVRAMFEIGGGFGANVQLLLDNFADIRKVVYLDVVPNLYVGTCYLRTLFGAAVRDFSETSRLSRIGFADDDSLEILAIAPWQIEQLDLGVDLFWNSSSFVEMPREVVGNYARQVLALKRASTAALVLASYGGGGPNTVPPEDLPGFFAGREFTGDEYRLLDHPVGYRGGAERDARDMYVFVSPGEHAASGLRRVHSAVAPER
jgi:putative sugar O-methyltransferase